MILTDEEIEKCRELAFRAAKKSQQSCKGQQVTTSDDYEYQFAWAIEAAVLAKLNCAEPVPVIDLKHTAYDSLCDAAAKSKWMPEQYTANDWLYDCAQYLIEGHQPEPSVPEGFTLAPNDPTEVMLSAAMSRYKHQSDSAAMHFMQMHRENFKHDYIAMLAEARSENAAISQNEEA